LLKKDNKKAHISEALAGGEIQALQSANADQHRDRITRFATLKHRAKNQENYLFTLAKFKENYEKDVKNEESIKALKSAQKLITCFFVFTALLSKDIQYRSFQLNHCYFSSGLGVSAKMPLRGVAN
jgi:hypothetical protein